MTPRPTWPAPRAAPSSAATLMYRLPAAAQALAHWPGAAAAVGGAGMRAGGRPLPGGDARGHEPAPANPRSNPATLGPAPSSGSRRMRAHMSFTMRSMLGTRGLPAAPALQQRLTCGGSPAPSTTPSAPAAAGAPCSQHRLPFLTHIICAIAGVLRRQPAWALSYRWRSRMAVHAADRPHRVRAPLRLGLLAQLGCHAAGTTHACKRTPYPHLPTAPAAAACCAHLKTPGPMHRRRRAAPTTSPSASGPPPSLPQPRRVLRAASRQS